MNNLQYFWNVEDQALRGDPADSIHRLERGRAGSALLKLDENTTMPIRLESWTLRIPPVEPDRINIFCMYALRPEAGTFPVDGKNLNFGDHALVLTEPQRFIDRIHEILTDKHIQHCAGLVEYYDDAFFGKVGPFRKHRAFSYQSEWRLVCYGGPGGVLQLEIGSLKHMATLIRSTDINRVVTVHDSPQAAGSESAQTDRHGT